MLQHESTLPVPPLLAALRSHTSFAPVKALLRVIAATLYLACAGCVAAPVQRVHPASETSSVATLSDAEDAQIIREVVGEFINAGLYGDEFRDPQNGQSTMPSGFRLQNGQDFDDIFEPRGSTTAGSATGYKTSDGVDLNQRYRAASGSDLVLFDTHYKKSGGTDLRQSFQRRAFNPGIPAPQVSAITSNSPVIIGNTLSLSVTATGTSLQYQWFKDYNPITGATSSSYSIAVSAASDSGTYSCVVQNGGGAITVSIGVAVVASTSNLPTISSLTNNSPKTLGETVTLTCTASGTGDLRYLWAGPTRLVVSYGTSNTYAFTVASGSEAGVYTCIVSNSYGFTSATTTVTLTGAGPTITSTSNNSPVYVGDTVYLSVTATGSDLTYQWYDNTTPIPGATSSSYSFYASSSVPLLSFYCGVTSAGVTVWGSFSVTINDSEPVVPSVSISGPSSVSAGVYIADAWTLNASADYPGLKRVRFQIIGHGFGSWTDLGGTTSWSTIMDWTNMGVPDIFNTPGTYTFYFEAESMEDQTAYTTLDVTVN
jgi:hypothetical protein